MPGSRRIPRPRQPNMALPGGLACRTTFPPQAAGRSGGQEPVNQERAEQSSGWWQVGCAGDPLQVQPRTTRNSIWGITFSNFNVCFLRILFSDKLLLGCHILWKSIHVLGIERTASFSDATIFKLWGAHGPTKAPKAWSFYLRFSAVLNILMHPF